MKKNIILIFILGTLLVLSDKAFSQNGGPLDPVSPGDWVLNVGIGAGTNGYGYRGSGFGPGFQVAVERGMWQLGPGTLTLGGEVGFAYFAHRYSHYRYTWFHSVIAARSAYHYGWKVRGLDTYGGLAAGFRILSFTRRFDDGYNDIDSYNPGSFGPHVGVFVGTSYFFGPNFGVNAELGYNINFAQIGVIFKLN